MRDAGHTWPTPWLAFSAEGMPEAKDPHIERMSFRRRASDHHSIRMQAGEIRNRILRAYLLTPNTGNKQELVDLS